jgi:hypothetical protein
MTVEIITNCYYKAYTAKYCEVKLTQLVLHFLQKNI